MPTLFDPFRSGGRATGRGDGLGLGLFIAKAIARAHEGTIEVESADFAGTTFRLVLSRCPSGRLAQRHGLGPVGAPIDPAAPDLVTG